MNVCVVGCTAPCILRHGPSINQKQWFYCDDKPQIPVSGVNYLLEKNTDDTVVYVPSHLIYLVTSPTKQCFFC